MQYSVAEALHNWPKGFLLNPIQYLPNVKVLPPVKARVAFGDSFFKRGRKFSQYRSSSSDKVKVVPISHVGS